MSVLARKPSLFPVSPYSLFDQKSDTASEMQPFYLQTFSVVLDTSQLLLGLGTNLKAE
jgi:hypothetical protein